MQSVFLMAEAYNYLERYDEAVEVLEAFKSRFPHDARVFQAVTGLTQVIRQAQQEKEKINATEEQAVSAAPATVGSVSP